MNMPVTLIIIILMLIAPLHRNYAQLALDAQIRQRAEMRDGYRKIAVHENWTAYHIAQRTRLIFAYEAEKLRITITPQDVRVWGDDQFVGYSGNSGNDASLDLFEGYVEIKLGHAGWLAAGRQSLSYDNQALLSPANWNMNGNSTDALLLKLFLVNWQLHLGGSWNTRSALSSGNVYPPDRYKSLNFAWANRKLGNNLSLSLLHIASGVTQSDTTDRIFFRQTTGFYTHYKTSAINAWLSAFYQAGKNQQDRPVSAFLADARAGYTFGVVSHAIGMGYQSGNKIRGENLPKDNCFDYLYRSRHSFFGGIDYFVHSTSSTNQAGLLDLHTSAQLKASAKIELTSTLHYFELAVLNSPEFIHKRLGIEHDLIVRYKFSDWGQVEGGWLFFLPTETLRKIQGIESNRFSQFAYLQLSVNPAIYRSITAINGMNK